MKKKNKSNEKICGIVTAIMLFIITVIICNSLYTDGYNATSYSVDSGIISEMYGYTQDGNAFTVNGEDSYLKLANTSGISEIMMYFNNYADSDIPVKVNYYDNQGNLLENENNINWKNGTNYFKISVENQSDYGIIVKIPYNFNLENVVYASKLTNGLKTSESIIIVAIFMIVIWWILLLSDRYKKIFEQTRKNVCDFTIGYYDIVRDKKWNEIKNHIKVVYIIIASGVLSVIFVKIISLSGKCKFNVKTVVLLLGLMFIIDLIVFCRKLFSKKIELIGFLVIVLVGTMFVALEPASPGVSWDDETHYSRVVNMSHSFDKKIALSDKIMLERFSSVALQKSYYSQQDQTAYVKYLNVLEKSKYYVDYSGSGISLVNTAYLPEAVGLVIGRGIGLPYIMTYKFGKMVNVFLLAILVFFAMKKLKYGKIIILLIALIPTNIFLAGNYTYDTWLTGWAMLGLSTFFGELQEKEKKIERKSILLIYVSMFLAILPKMVYFPLIFIVFFMPFSKFDNKKEYWIYKVFTIIICVLPFIMVYIQNIAATTNVADTRGGETVSSTSQIDYIKSNFYKALMTLVTFLKTYLNPFVEGNEYINQLAYNGYIPLQNSLLIVIIVGALISRDEKEDRIFPWWFKIGTLAVYAGIGAIAALSMYVMFTPVGSDVVNGCQGRYIMPVLFPTLYVLSRFRAKTFIKNAIGEANVNVILIFIMSVASLYGMWVGCVSLY